MQISGPFYVYRCKRIYYVQYTQAGQTKQKSTSKTRKTDALSFIEQMRENIPVASELILSLSVFKKIYFEHKNKVVRPSTLERTAYAIARLIAICGDKRMHSYTSRDLSLFKTGRLKECSPVTVNIDLRHLKGVFTVAKHLGYIETNPFQRLDQLPIPQRLPMFLNQEEASCLLKSIENSDVKDMAHFAICTGLRLGEVVALNWAEVDFGSGLIAVTNTDQFITKSGKTRIVPMHDSARRLLVRRSLSCCKGHVFQNRWGRTYIKSFVSRNFKMGLMKAGLSVKLGFHGLRHTFASWLVQSGVSLYEVHKFLGHSAVTITQVYSHLMPSQLRHAVDRLPYI